MNILRVVQRVKEDSAKLDVYMYPIKQISRVKCNYIPVPNDKADMLFRQSDLPQKDQGEKENETIDNTKSSVEIMLNSGHVDTFVYGHGTKFIVVDTEGSIKFETKSVELFSYYITQQYEDGTCKIIEDMR